MRFGLISSFVLLVGLANCGARSTAGSLQARLDDQLAVNAQRHGIAGQAVLIARDGKVIYRGSHGLANRETRQPVHVDTVFPVFSVSKLFVSALVMQLVEQGQLDLEQPVGTYLPDIPELHDLAALPAGFGAVKVADVLNHASGLPEYFDASKFPFKLPPTRQAAFAVVASKPFQFTPGTTTRYTQTNFLILGAILEAHYHMPYRQIVAERIIQPLGLQHSYLGKSNGPRVNIVKNYIGKDNKLTIEEGPIWPEYSNVHVELYTTVDDLGRFLIALCDGRLVKPETLQRLWKPYRYRGGGAGEFAAGWEYGTAGRYKHVGHDGGTKVRVRLMFGDSLAKDTWVVVYLTNGSATGVWSRRLIESVMTVAAPDAFR